MFFVLTVFFVCRIRTAPRAVRAARRATRCRVVGAAVRRERVRFAPSGGWIVRPAHHSRALNPIPRVVRRPPVASVRIGRTRQNVGGREIRAGRAGVGARAK